MDVSRELFERYIGSRLEPPPLTLPLDLGEPLGAVSGEGYRIGLGSLGLLLELPHTLARFTYVDVQVECPSLRDWAESQRTLRGWLRIGSRGGPQLSVAIDAPTLSGLIDSLQRVGAIIHVPEDS